MRHTGRRHMGDTIRGVVCLSNVKGKVDFTRGNIIYSIAAFSIPIVMGELLQNLYNSVDALVVGNFVSDSALAAVTVGGIIANMVVNFFNGMSVGANVVISNAFGKGDEVELRSKVRIAFTFAAVLGVVLSVFGMIITPQLLYFAGAKPEYYDQALLYLRIYLAGLMFTVIYNNGAGILRAIGDSQTPFRILLISCGTNIVLDLVFVVMLNLGVVGVALATVLSQGLSVTLVYRAISRAQQVNCLDFRELRLFGGKVVHDILNVGMAAGMQSALIGFSNIFVVRYMNLFSTSAVAGIGIAQRLDKFIVLPAKSFGITMTTFVSQNIGARRFERIREGKRKCLTVALGVTILISAVVYLFADRCVSLFNSEPQVVSVGVDMMHVLIPLFWTMATREVYLGVLRGYGKNFVPMVLNLVGMVVVRQIFLSITMNVANPAIEQIYYCYPIAWVATAAMLFIYYLAVRDSLIGLSAKNDGSQFDEQFDNSLP